MKFPLYEFFRPLYGYFLALLGVHKLCNTYQAFEREMKRNFLTNKLYNNYRLQRDSLIIAFYVHKRSSDHTIGSLLTDTSDADGHLYTDGHLCIAAT